MKSLYIETGNYLIIHYHILPYLRKQACKREKIKDFENLLLVDTKLNKLINNNIKNPLLPKCSLTRIENVQFCTVHCRAMPLYKYIIQKFKKHKKSENQYIHFKKKMLADIFKKIYISHIHRGYHSKKLTSCCSGKGYLIKNTPCWSGELGLEY